MAHYELASEIKFRSSPTLAAKADHLSLEAIIDPSKLSNPRLISTTVGEELVLFEDTPRRYRKHVEKALELYQLQLDIAETFATPLEVFSLYLQHGTP